MGGLNCKTKGERRRDLFAKKAEYFCRIGKLQERDVFIENVDDINRPFQEERLEMILANAEGLQRPEPLGNIRLREEEAKEKADGGLVAMEGSKEEQDDAIEKMPARQAKFECSIVGREEFERGWMSRHPEVTGSYLSVSCKQR